MLFNVHTSVPFWHVSCGQNVALLLRCYEMSCQSDVRLGGDWLPYVSCVNDREGRWQLRSDFQFLILVQLGHSCPWKIHPWQNFVPWCKVMKWIDLGHLIDGEISPKAASGKAQTMASENICIYPKDWFFKKSFTTFNVNRKQCAGVIFSTSDTVYLHSSCIVYWVFSLRIRVSYHTSHLMIANLLYVLQWNSDVYITFKSIILTFLWINYKHRLVVGLLCPLQL